MILTPNKGCVIAGFSDSYGPGTEWYVNRIDSAGNLIWSRTFDYQQGGANNVSITKDVNGGFLLAGSAGNTNSSSFALVLARMNTNGFLTWSKMYDSNYDDVPNSAYQDSSGSIYVSGTRSYQAWSSDLTLAKFDSAGNPGWKFEYGGTGVEVARSFCLDHHSLVAAAYSTSYSSQLMLLKTDTDGNVLHEKVFPGSDFCSVSTANDNGLILSDPLYNSITGHNDLYTVKTDSSLVSNCNETDVQDSARQYSWSSSTISLLAGIPPTTVAGYSLQRLNINVHDSLLCYMLGVNEMVKNDILKIFPDPVSNVLHFSSDHDLQDNVYEIYDAAGKKICWGKCSNSEIDVHSLVAGFYILRMRAGQKIYSQEFIKE
jgi:hypothetical protein